MKFVREFITSTVVGGLFIVVPVYLAVLLLLKGMQTVGALVRPVAAVLPDWMPAEGLISLLLVLAICFVVGMAVRTQAGRALRGSYGGVIFEKLPGYDLLRSLTRRLAGDTEQEAWKPALVEIEDALVPAFIIEEHDDGQYTIFVPSVPTPFAGAVYVISGSAGTRRRCSLHPGHPVDFPLGRGSRELVAAMRKDRQASAAG